MFWNEFAVHQIVVVWHRKHGSIKFVIGAGEAEKKANDTVS